MRMYIIRKNFTNSIPTNYSIFHLLKVKLANYIYLFTFFYMLSSLFPFAKNAINIVCCIT